MSEGGNVEDVGIAGLSERDRVLLNQTAEKIQQEKSSEAVSPPETEAVTAETKVEGILESIRTRLENETNEPEDIKVKPEGALYDLKDIIDAEYSECKDTDTKTQLAKLELVTEQLKMKSKVTNREWEELYNYVNSNMLHWGKAVINSDNEAIAQSYQRIFGSIRKELFSYKELIDDKHPEELFKDEDDENLPYPKLQFEPQESEKELLALAEQGDIDADKIQTYLAGVDADFKTAGEDPQLTQLARAVDEAKNYLKSKFRNFRAKNKYITVTFHGNQASVKVQKKSSNPDIDPEHGRYAFLASSTLSDPLSIGYSEKITQQADVQRKNVQIASQNLEKLKTGNSGTELSCEEAITITTPLDIHLFRLKEQENAEKKKIVSENKDPHNEGDKSDELRAIEKQIDTLGNMLKFVTERTENDEIMSEEEFKSLPEEAINPDGALEDYALHRKGSQEDFELAG